MTLFSTAKSLFAKARNAAKFGIAAAAGLLTTRGRAKLGERWETPREWLTRRCGVLAYPTPRVECGGQRYGQVQRARKLARRGGS